MLASLLLITALSSHPGEFANQCVMLDKPEELWALSDLVFLGTVAATKPTGTRGSHVTVDIGTFRVERAWKGDPGSTVDVGGDAFFEKGKQYLVFAGGKPPSTTLPCRWTELADGAKTKLAWLEKTHASSARSPVPEPVGTQARVGSVILQLEPTRIVRPVLPEAARRQGIVGPVLVEVRISEAGDVSVLRVVRGHSLLNEAATAAVAQWKYPPTVIEGRTLSVIAIAVVSFSQN